MNKKRPTTIKISVDSSGAITSSQNESIEERNKHIDIQYHFVREDVSSKRISVSHWRKEDQVSDILTKVLLRVKLLKFRSELGIVPKSFQN